MWHSRTFPAGMLSLIPGRSGLRGDGAAMTQQIAVPGRKRGMQSRVAPVCCWKNLRRPCQGPTVMFCPSSYIVRMRKRNSKGWATPLWHERSLVKRDPNVACVRDLHRPLVPLHEQVTLRQTMMTFVSRPTRRAGARNLKCRVDRICRAVSRLELSPANKATEKDGLPPAIKWM